MSGNVWEWCQDWYGKDYYSSNPRDNPQGPSSGSDRVLRGGSWYNSPQDVRASDRGGDFPLVGNIDSGFRLVLPSR